MTFGDGTFGDGTFGTGGDNAFTFPILHTGDLPWWSQYVDLIVELGIGTKVNRGTVAQWDTAQWDNAPSGTWSGIEPDWVQVNPCNMLDVSITRGRDRWTDRFGASSAAFNAQDPEGRLSWDSSDFDDQLEVRPGREFRIRARVAGVTYDLWRGWLETVDDEFNPGTVPIAKFTAQDGYASLAHINLLKHDEPDVGAGQWSHERVNMLLDMADWPQAWRDIDLGRITVQATDLSRAVSDELSITAESEGGAIFADRQGNLAFRNRDWIRVDPNARAIQATIGGTSHPPLPPTTYLHLDTSSSDYASTPDPPIPGPHALYRATTGQAAATPKPALVFSTQNVLQVSCRIRMDDYSPSAGLALVDQYWVATDTSYKLAILSGTTAGCPHFIWSNGTAFVQRTCPVTLQSVVENGQPVSLRVTLTCNDGNGNNVVAFEYSLSSSDVPQWLPLGAPIVTAGTTSGNPNATRQLTIANQPGSSQAGVIRVQWAKATFDGVKQFDIDFRDKPLGTAAVTDAVGNVFTLNGGAAIVEAPIINPAVPYGLRINTAGDYAETGDVPHGATANVYDVRVWAALDKWAPGSSIQQQVLVKWNAGINAREYFLNVLQDGKLAMNWSTTGVNFSGNVASTVVVPFNAGQKAWIRAVLDVKGGTADPTVTFYTSTDDSPTPTTWTQLGTVVTKTAFQGYVTDKGAPLTVVNPTANAAPGKIFAARVIVDGVTTTSPDFYLQETDASFTDAQSNVWTPRGGAHITGNPSGALDLRAWLAMNNWQNNPHTESPLVTQWGSGGLSYAFQRWGATGSSLRVVASSSYAMQATVPLPTTWTNNRVHVRVVVIADNGHGQRTATFYYSTESNADPQHWVQSGDVVVGTPNFVLVNSTSQVRIGNRENNAAPFLVGDVFSASVRMNGVLITNPDFTALEPGTTIFTDAVGNVWTVSDTATIDTNEAASAMAVCAASYDTTRAADDIVNDIQVAQMNGPIQQFTDEASISAYRRRTYKQTDFICEDDEQVAILGRRILQARAGGQVRLPSVVITPTDNLHEWQFVCEVDYGWRLEVHYPATNGTDWKREVLVQGIAHKITPDGWETELRVDDAFAGMADTWDGQRGWDQALWSEVH